MFDPKQGGALNDVGSYVVGFVLGLVDAPVESVESHIEKENEIEMNFKATLNFKNEVQGKVEGSINYNKERYALIKGEKGEIYVPMFNLSLIHICTTEGGNWICLLSKTH